jgi:superfamily II DNA or RNA helicase
VIKLTRHAIQTSTNYFEFNQLISRLPSATRGDAQEIFAKHYFEAYKKHFNVSTYCSRLLKDKVPEGLSNSDLGSDGIIVHSSGEFSLVQVKFRSDWTASLHRNCLGGASLEALVLPNFSKLYLFSNTVVPPKNITVAEQSKLKYIMMTDLYNCDWSRIQESVLNQGELVRSTPPSLYKWQNEAREHVLRETSKFGKKTVVAMCGSGKTVFGNTILEKYNSVLIVVPNLQLLGQWFERIASWNPERQFLLVGSDLDDVCESIPYTLTTDSDVIASHGRDNLVCISTYQSLDLLVETPVFDLAIVDEAHVTCGTGVTNFTLIHRQLLARNKLFLTATPKIYNVASDDFVSMNDTEKFGAMYTYSCKEAIDDGIVSNYKIVIGHGRGSNHEEFNAQFLCESVRKHSLNSVLVCSVSHKASKELYNQVQKIGLPSHELLLMPASATSAHKNRAIGYANSRKPVIIFNVRVFSLGTDIPSLESVMILGDRKSVIDTVQTVSRCLRKYPGKEYGYILIPCLLSGEGDMEEEGDYINVRRIISSMGSVDSALVETVVLRGSGGRGIICSSVGTNEMVREVDTDMDFELALYDSMGEREFSVEFKFAKLMEFCEKEGRLPKAKEEWNGTKIGVFLVCLLCSGLYSNSRHIMLDKLKKITKINEELRTRLNNLNDEEKKVSRTISTEKRFLALMEFCEKEGRLPGQKEQWSNVKIGVFLGHLLQGKRFEKTRLVMINQLRDLSKEIEARISERLEHINDDKKKVSRLIPVKERFSMLVEFCKEIRRLPRQKEEWNGVKIGSFLTNLLGGRRLKAQRATYLDQLSRISPEIREAIESRAKP